MESMVIAHLPEQHKAQMVRQMILGGHGVSMPAGGVLLPSGGDAFPAGGGFFGSALKAGIKAGTKGASFAWRHRQAINTVAQAGASELAKASGTAGDVGRYGSAITAGLGTIL